MSESRQPTDPQVIYNLVELLSPLLTTGVERASWLTQAFRLEPEVLARVDFAGPTPLFVSKLVQTLIEYGLTADGRPALTVFMETVAGSIGAESRARLFAIRDRLYPPPPGSKPATPPVQPANPTAGPQLPTAPASQPSRKRSVNPLGAVLGAAGAVVGAIGELLGGLGKVALPGDGERTRSEPKAPPAKRDEQPESTLTGGRLSQSITEDGPAERSADRTPRQRQAQEEQQEAQKKEQEPARRSTRGMEPLQPRFGRREAESVDADADADEAEILDDLIVAPKPKPAVVQPTVPPPQPIPAPAPAPSAPPAPAWQDKPAETPPADPRATGESATGGVTPAPLADLLEADLDVDLADLEAEPLVDEEFFARPETEAEESAALNVPAPGEPQNPVPAGPPEARPEPAPRPAKRQAKPVEETIPMPELERAITLPESDEVFFSAFYPREAAPEQRYGLYVYAHLETALAQIQKDAEKFKDELGGQVPAPKTAKDSGRIPLGAPITVTPVAEGISFDPPAITKKWDRPFTRFNFDFKPGRDLAEETLTGRISITLHGVEIAHIKFAIEVGKAGKTRAGAPAPDMVAAAMPANPLAAAKSGLTRSAPAHVYEKIFVSYSRRDKAVVESYRAAQMALGREVFMDTYSIRIGANWQAALADFIDRADVFQLFWSEASAHSKNVQDEWDYALNFRCPDDKCADFILPVYWTTPMPVPPPPELGHLNFKYAPLAPAPRIRILFLAANPHGTEALRLAEEAREIQDFLDKSNFGDRFEIVHEWAARAADIQGHLMRYSPHILHFSGHGSQAGEIILEDETGSAQPVTPAAMGRLLGLFRETVRCVVLNACFSDAQGAALADEVDCVVGMRREIEDKAAIRFAAGFYQALGYAKDVQTAFALGCNAVDLAVSGDAESIPQMRVRAGVDAGHVRFVEEPTA